MQVTRVNTQTPWLQCDVRLEGKGCANFAVYDYYLKDHELSYVRLCEYHDRQYVKQHVSYELVGLP